MGEITTRTDKDSIVLPVKRTDGATLEDRLTKNAYQNILPARYLRKDSKGEIIEPPERLFRRIANNIALAEAVYEADKENIKITVTPDQIKPKHPRRVKLIEEVFGEIATGKGEIIVADNMSTELTDRNISKFSYETIIPLLPKNVREHVESVADQFCEFMEDLSFIPNSPTIMNAGDELQQLSACFVDSPQDDIVDIHHTALEAAQVFQSGGGMGYAFWRIRPYGDTVGSTGGIASGPITFMETFDQMCETIAQGGSRRGAQMAIMRISHPDVIEFIHAKNKDVSLAHSLRLNDPDDYTYTTFNEALEEARTLLDSEGRVPKHLRNAVEGHLSNFNVSVGVTDEFMEALENGKEYTLLNPRTGEPHIATKYTLEMYDRYDLGDYVKVGKPLSIPAPILWERIVEGAWENGEPGIIYLDRVNQAHSFPVESTPTGDSSPYEILATNPCGEQPLMEYEACNLGHINLSTIASLNAPDWRTWSNENGRENRELKELMADFIQKAIDIDEFDRRIRLGTRFLENVCTMSDFPVDRIEETVYNNRKIGLGIMGLAQLYVQLGLKYGSPEGNELARQVMIYINHMSKWTSHELAEIRGSFENWPDSKYADPVKYAEWFTKETGLDPEDWKGGFAIRNHNTTTIAPTGTTSMIANTTGGCEPIYSVAYYKNVSDDVQGDEMLVEFDDYFLRTIEANGIDVDEVKKEALVQMQNNEFKGIGGLSTVPDAIGELFVVSSEVSAIEHASVQCACQEGVDSAISKTCNFPNDATAEEMDEVYRYIYKNGGKGVTVYRDGSRTKQVLTTRAQNAEFIESGEGGSADHLLEYIDAHFDSLSDFLNHETIRAKITEEWKHHGEDLSIWDVPALAYGKSRKRPRPGVLYGLTQRIDTGYGKLYVNINEDDQGRPFELFANIGNSGGFTASFTEALAKIVSTALRSGVDPREIAGELKGIRSPKIAWDRGGQIQSIPDAIGTAMKRYLDGEIHKDYPQQKNLSEINKQEANQEAIKKVTPIVVDVTQSLIDAGESPECPSCGSLTLNFSEGCKTCESCGWSEC